MQRESRRLAAIVAADVAGFSRLVGRDEEGTLRALRAHRTDLIDPLIEQFNGRIANTAGDSLLLEFPSVVEAVRCAIAIQEGMGERTAAAEADGRITFRIGVNVGDVVAQGGDLLGDGVNIAARLEGVCEPGGLAISDDAYRQVRDRLETSWRDGGEYTVKNISRPIQVWFWTPSEARAVVADRCVPLAKQDGPSIVVVPFVGLGSGPQDDFIAKGLSEDLITTLCKIPRLLVVSRDASFTAAVEGESAGKIAEQLGVRYALDGNVRSAGEVLRINAQLIDCETGHHLWAERFDGKADDLFAFQDDIVRRILIELQVHLTAGEHARVTGRGTENLPAWLLLVDGFETTRQLTRESTIRARKLFQTAHELDTGWARPLVGLSWTYWFGARMGLTDTPKAWIRRGVELAENAIDLDPDDPGGYQMLGFLAQLQGDHERAVTLREQALEIAPGDFFVVYGLASVLANAGQPERAIAHFDHARRLSPTMPPGLLMGIAEAQLLAGKLQDAIDNLTEAAAQTPDVVHIHVLLVAVYIAAERIVEAKRQAMNVLRLEPDFTIQDWMRTRLYRDQETSDWVAGLLGRAGLLLAK